MEGPGVVPLGETVQFRLFAHLSNGSRRDVTTEAAWSVTGTRLIVAGPGLITGRERGDAGVHASFNDRSDGKAVSVLLAGTFNLFGKVREAGSHYGWLFGATLKVVSGVGTGLSASTTWAGEYRLSGVAGQIGLLVTRDGYQPTLQVVNVEDYQAAPAIIELSLAKPRVDLSGTYTITIAASDECGTGSDNGQLPENARVRSYAAEVVQDGPMVSVFLIDTGGSFLGQVDPMKAEFVMPYVEDGSPSFVDRISPSQLIGVFGTVVVTPVTPNHLAGMLNGSILVSDANSIWWPPFASCFSTRHRFVMSR
jgi:hypothetical protein